MKTMIRCCAVFFCFLLLFLLPFIAANPPSDDNIACLRMVNYTSSIKTETPRMVNCSGTCAFYICLGQVNNGFGCSSDFYGDCSNEATAIQFIKSKTPEKFVYNDGTVSYYSGCDSKNTTENMECFKEKVIVMNEQLSKKTPSIDDPIWYYEKPLNLAISQNAVKVAGMMMAFLGLIFAQFY